MKNTKTWMSWLGAGAIVFAGVAGCGSPSDQADPSQADANRTGAMSNETSGVSNAVENVPEVAGNVANATGNQVAGAGNVASNMAGGAANTVSNGVAATGNAVSGVAKTPVIKAALLNNAVTMKIKNLNVDTVGNTVTLSGSGSQAAKTLAGNLAKQQAGAGYTIKNNITVGK